MVLGDGHWPPKYLLQGFTDGGRRKVTGVIGASQSACEEDFFEQVAGLVAVGRGFIGVPQGLK